MSLLPKTEIFEIFRPVDKINAGAYYLLPNGHLLTWNEFAAKPFYYKLFCVAANRVKRLIRVTPGNPKEF